MIAIAGRDVLSSMVTEKLIANGDESVTMKVLSNTGAEISGSGYNLALDRFGNHETIQSGIIDRKTLPASIIQRLVHTFSEEMLARFADKHKVPISEISHIVSEVKDRTALGLATGLSPHAMALFIEQLEEQGGITYSMLLRTLCTGHLDFIVHVIAMRSCLSPEYVKARLLSHSLPSIKQLWMGAKLPAALLDILVGSVEVILQAQRDEEMVGLEDYRERIIERILASCANSDAKFTEEDLDHILDIKFGAERIN